MTHKSSKSYYDIFHLDYRQMTISSPAFCDFELTADLKHTCLMLIHSLTCSFASCSKLHKAVN